MAVKKNNDTIRWRLTSLERTVEGLDVKVESIMSNHLPHLREDVISLKTRVTLVAGLNILAIVIACIFAYLIR